MNKKRFRNSFLISLAVLCASTPLIMQAADFSDLGALNDPNSVQPYIFTVGGTGPSTVTILSTSNGVGGFDPILAVFDANGHLIDTDDDSGGNLDFSLTLNLDPGTYRGYLAQFNNFPKTDDLTDGFFPNNNTSFGGTSFFAVDFQNIETLTKGEQFIGLDPTFLGEPEATVFAFRRSGPSVLEVTDFGAILSATASALPFALAQREIQFDAARTPIRDLDSRLFRLRSRARVTEVAPPPVEDIAMDKSGKPLGASKDAKKVVIVDATSAPAPVKTLAVYLGGDFSATDQDALSQAAGFDTETWSGTVGLEYSPTPELTLGLGLSYVHTDVDLGYLGDSEVEGVAISPYVSFYKDGFYADALYSAGIFDNDFSRDTLLHRKAKGSADSFDNTVELHAGYNIEVGNLITGPILGGEYVNGSLDGYTENSGGTANVTTDKQNYDSLVSEIGWQASLPIEAGGVRITPQLRASWKHQFTDEGDNVGVELAQSPFITVRDGHSSRHGHYEVSGDTSAPSDDYASLGAGVSFAFGDWSLILDYEGEYFRQDDSAHFASIRAGYKF